MRDIACQGGYRYIFYSLYPLRACYIFQNYSLRYICFYDDLEKSLVRVGQSTNFHSLLHYKVDIFLKIMCSLDNKYNRKMCVFKKRPIFPHSLLHYKVDIFSFLSLSLISNYSASERFLKSRLLALHSTLYFTIRLIYFCF